MNIDDVLKLVNAGYTREEIDKMTQAPGSDPGQNPGNDPGDNPGQDPGNNPGSDPGQNPGNDPGQNQELDQLRQELTQTQTQLKELVKQMQSNNLKTASVNIVPDADLEKKTDAALAELIRPTINKED
jgi:DNA-binding transcriptional MerR regulator